MRKSEGKTKKILKRIIYVILTWYLLLNMARCTFGGVSYRFASETKKETINDYESNKEVFKYVSKKITESGESIYFYKGNVKTRTVKTNNSQAALMRDEEFMSKVSYILYDLNYKGISGGRSSVIFEKLHKNKFYAELQYYINSDDNSQESSGEIQLDTNFFYTSYYLS